MCIRDRDEPTNHLDLKAKAVLKEALKNFDGSLIVVSHDRDFLGGLTEFVYEVTPNRLKQYIGDIKNFLHEKHADSIGQYEASKTGERVLGKGKSNKKTPKAAPSDQKLSKEERKAKDKALRQAIKKVQRFEKLVAKAEEELKAKNVELTAIDPTDRKGMTDLSYEFEEIQKKHDELLQQWEEALIEKDLLEG